MAGKDMRVRRSFVLLFAIVLSSCVTTETSRQESVPKSIQEQGKTGHWIAGPQDGYLTIIGISNPLLKKEAEIQSALEDAARKASMYHGIQGAFVVASAQGSGFLDNISDIAHDLQYGSDYEQYLDRLIFDPKKDVFRIDGAVFVRTKYMAPGLGNIRYTPAGNGGRPSWINFASRPGFNNYRTEVGVARNQRWLKDTINKSIENAAAMMIQGAASEITTNVVSISGLGSSSQIYTKSTGRLERFQVLEFWINPETDEVWTLAIAQVYNN